MARRRTRVVAAAAVLAAVGLTACGGGELTAPSAVVTPDGLVGQTWRLSQLNGQAVIDGSTVTAEFTSEARVAGKATCNQYMGSARAEDGGRLTVGPLAMTLMACSPQSLMDQEQRYVATLQAAKSYAVVGDELRLGPSASETTLVYRR